MALEILQSAIFFIFGSLIGSFLNVVILRGIEEKEIVLARSACPRCKKILQWWELIPILSFIILRGKCAGCRKPISIQYPIVELAMGIVLLVLGSQALAGSLSILNLVISVVIASLLIVLFVTDLYTMLLPDIFVVLLGVAVVLRLGISYITENAYPLSSVVDSLLGAVIGAGFLLFLWLITRGRGIGFGDVKLMLPLGALFGIWGTIVLLFLSFMAGGLVGLFLLLRRRATMKTAIPFGPFLAGSALLLLLAPQTTRFVVLLAWPLSQY